MLPRSVTIPAFSLNVMMCGQLNAVASWRGEDFPWQFVIHDWGLLSTFWSFIKEHPYQIERGNVRRSFRAQFANNNFIRTNNRDVFQFNGSLFIEDWEIIHNIELLRPWIMTRFQNRTQLHIPPGVMLGASIQEATDRYDFNSKRRIKSAIHSKSAVQFIPKVLFHYKNIFKYGLFQH